LPRYTDPRLREETRKQDLTKNHARSALTLPRCPLKKKDPQNCKKISKV